MSLSLGGLAPQYYLPYAEKAAAAAKDGKPLADLLKRFPQVKNLVDTTLKQHGKSAADVVYFPLSAKVMMMTVLLDAKTGAIIAILPLNSM